MANAASRSDGQSGGDQGRHAIELAGIEGGVDACADVHGALAFVAVRFDAFRACLCFDAQGYTFLLMGTAGPLPTAPKEKTVFIEDLPERERVKGVRVQRDLSRQC